MTDAAVVIPKLLSAREVAEATGLSVWAVYDLVREKRIPHRRLGRKVVFTASAVAAFFTNGDTPTPPAATITTAAKTRKRSR